MRALKWIEDVKTRPGWLIFYGHDVRENPGMGLHAGLSGDCMYGRG
jgi:hypothetical protein